MGRGQGRRITLRAVRKAAHILEHLPVDLRKIQMGHKPDMTTAHYSASLAARRAVLVTKALDQRRG